MRLIKELKKHKPKIIKYGGIALGVFVALNFVTWVIFYGRTYPKTTVAGQQLGSQPLSSLGLKLEKMTLMPKKITLSYNQASGQLTPDDLGLRLDVKATTEAAGGHGWLPLFNLLGNRDVPLSLNANNAKLKQAIQSFANQHQKAAVDARPVIQNGVFTLRRAAAGDAVDMAKAPAIVIKTVGTGKTAVVLPVKTVKPKISDADATMALTGLQSQQKTTLAYTYQGRTTKPTAAEIAGFYADTDGGYSLSEDKVEAYITKVGGAYGIRVQNLSAAAAGTIQALSKNQAYNVELVALPRATRTFTYCTAVRGVDASNLTALEAKLAGVYGDSRGWGLDGQITFRKVASGCDFTVWLSAASQMPSFGAICDSTWSCTVSPNVILNFDRWSGASSAWNSAGGSLDDYRSMVINHETGHWLGFGHKYCAGSGQLAPVMQQQSIDLQGCKFNPWPLASELAQLKAHLGL